MPEIGLRQAASSLRLIMPINMGPFAVPRILLFLLVWLVPTAASADAVPQADVDQAIRTGSRWLLADLKPRLERQAGAEPGRTALSYYALLHSNVSREHEVMQMASDFVAKADSYRTYDLGCLILALASEDPVKHADRIHDFARRLAGSQNPAGDWGYPGGADLSNTQYAALGLWKATQAGVRVHPTVWKRLARRTLQYQTGSGSFGYGHGSNHGTPSMTAAGAGVLAICEQQLRLAGELNYELADQIVPLRRQSQAWLAAELREHVGATSWHYYYLYGLERVGALTGHTFFVDQDWYRLGAQKLLADQHENGAWASDDIKTSFALLFLARATSSMGRAVAFTGEVSVTARDADAICQLQAEGNGPVKLGVGWWNRAALREYEWPNERGLGPRISWVEFYADDQRIAVQLADQSRPLGNQYFHFKHHFQRKGAKQIWARFHVVPPPHAKQLSAVLESPRLLTLVEHSLPRQTAQWPQIYGGKMQLNGGKTWASSRAGKRDGLANGYYSADQAVDHLEETAWVFRAKDDKRTFKLRPTVKLPTCAIQITPPSGEWAEAAGLQRLGMLEVRINSDLRLPLLMPKNGQPGVLDLPEAVVIKTLEIRVLTLGEAISASDVTGQKESNRPQATGLSGIAEIEFYFGG